MKALDSFNNTIDLWTAALQRYSFEQLCKKPSANAWSLGQVCVHILEDSGFYLEQIHHCVAESGNHENRATPDGQKMLDDNAFPDVAIEGAPDHPFMPQPVSKEKLIADLYKLKADMNEAAKLIARNPSFGRTQHPGFGYFDAMEWLQFADMHMRHHFRQKARIDNFLNVI